MKRQTGDSPSPHRPGGWLHAIWVQEIREARERGGGDFEMTAVHNGNTITVRAHIDNDGRWRTVETVEQAAARHTARTRSASPTRSVPLTRAPRARSRESHRNRPGQRRTRRSSAARSPDDDSGPSEPPPLPYRIAGPAGDNRGVEAAFLQILTRRHPGRRWELRHISEPIAEYVADLERRAA